MSSFQIRTYFGVPIPPFNEESISMGVGALTLRFVITGKIPSKKNSQIVRIAYTKQKKPYVRFIGNPEYKKFEDRNKGVMLAQMMEYRKTFAEKGLTFPISRASMVVKFYFKDLYEQDLSNKAETIQDLLVACKILEDDNYKILNPVTYMGKSFKDEITENIALIAITIPNLNK